MSKNIFSLILVLLLAGAVLTGCSAFHSFLGTNISDLESARADGIEKTIDLSYDASYDKVMAILEKSGVTYFNIVGPNGT